MDATSFLNGNLVMLYDEMVVPSSNHTATKTRVMNSLAMAGPWNHTGP